MVPDLAYWASPPPHLTLVKNQVHLWRFRLDLLAVDVDELMSLLNCDELARAEQLLDSAKAQRFVAAHGQMRQILTRYLDCSPDEVSFNYGAHGKPNLAGTAGEKLRFNLSHAGRWGLVAVTREADIGVDVEQLDLNLDYEKIAARFFSVEEKAELERYGALRRRRGFYRIWTRKEALLKGQGGGFSMPAAVKPGTKWQTRSFTVDRGYLGACAVAARVTSMCRWQFA